jgi:succinylglutamic semialdehyde dehydrogenase
MQRHYRDIMKYKLKGNYFNGKYFLPPTTGTDAVDTIFQGYSPANLEEHLWELAIEYRHVPQVIESATKGFETWKRTPVAERINALKRYQEVLTVKKDQIAEAIARETGKPLWEAYTEASSLIAKIGVTVTDGLARIENKFYKDIMPGTDGHVFFKPIGPSLIIGPFNFPCHLANGQITSALIAGNSIIFKPSEKTPYSASLMFDCMVEAKFPEGVINLIQGDGELTSRLVKDRAIRGVFFTGSKEVGMKILQATHTDLSKLVALELGGKNTTIIHNDADLELALPELLKACFWTTGQRCTSTAIVAIHDSIKDQFIKKFHDLAKKIIVDHPIEFEREPFMGPLIDKRALETYLLFMGMAKREGIEEIMRGKALEKTKHGHYVTPSIHYTESFNKKSHFLLSEIFGPNCTFIPYKEIDEAIAIANATEYGLAAAVFTKDKAIIEHAVQEIDSGLINFNRSTVGASAKLPFGGVKNSGNHRPAAISTIDACAYPLASLEITQTVKESLTDIKGLDL